MLTIVVALLAEAKPLIAYFDLKKDPKSLLPIYRSATYPLELIVTGSRISRVAAGVGIMGKQGNLWLNIGICGAKSKPVGSVFLASKLLFDKFVDYPTFLFSPPCQLHDVKTVLHPENEYVEDVLYEMEAHSFYHAARMFSSPELIHVLKIVSDTPNHSAKNLTKMDVHELIKMHLSTIETTINRMLAIPNLPIEMDLSCFLESWHFTETQKHQLKTLLLNRDLCSCYEMVKECKTAQQILGQLGKKVRLTID